MTKRAFPQEADAEPSFEAMRALAESAGRFRHPTTAVGVKEHPQEVLVRNGELAFPYFEGDVRWLPGSDSGLYLLLCVGEPLVFFGRDGVVDAPDRTIALHQGWLPVVENTWRHDGLVYTQQVFAHLADADRVTTGRETLVARVRLRVRNGGGEAQAARLLYLVGNMAVEGPPSLYYALSREEAPPPYRTPLHLEGDVLLNDSGQIVLLAPASDGVAWTFQAQGGNGSWQEGTAYRDGLEARFALGPGEERVLDLAVPYLPLERARENLLRAQSLDEALVATAATWERTLTDGVGLHVPSEDILRLVRAQLAYTFIVVDRVDKASLAGNGIPEAGHRWQFRRAGMEPPNIPIRDYRVPEGVWAYVNLNATDYEFIWGAESIGVVVPSLCRYGYLKEAREYLETLFALQGSSTVLFEDPALRPDDPDALGFYGTLPSYHNWLNEVGGILWGMGQYVAYSGDHAWVREHVDALLSACRWVQRRRSLTRDAAYEAARGLLPHGRATDSPQTGYLYYNDAHTLLGLQSISRAMVEAGVPEAEWVVREAEDYRRDIRRSLALAIVPVAEMPENEQDYDTSGYATLGVDDKLKPLARPGELPERWRGNVLLRSEATAAGLEFYVPSGADHRVPLKMPAAGLDVVTIPLLVYAAIDPESDEPLTPGCPYTDRQVWDQVCKYLEVSGAYSHVGLPFPSDGTPGYSYVTAQLLLARDCVEQYLTAAMGTMAFSTPLSDCAAVESIGNLVDHPFWRLSPMSLTMARNRDYLRQMLLDEDDRRGILRITPALPRAWLAEGETVSLTNAPTHFGPVSLKLSSRIDSAAQVRVDLAASWRKPPAEVRVRLRLPAPYRLVGADLEGVGPLTVVDEWITLPAQAMQRATCAVVARCERG
ncbi:MAG: hypothetical protein ACYC5M_08805 [Anaerolineae bacterium]